MTASHEQLQLMLIDGAIRFALKGREAIEARDFEGMFTALDRAQKIVAQIGAGLQEDKNPALVKQMKSLYNFVYRRLVDAHFQRDVAAVDEAVQILRHQRETWKIIADKVAAIAGKPIVNASIGGAAQPTAAPHSSPPSGFRADKSESAGSMLSLEG